MGSSLGLQRSIHDLNTQMVDEIIAWDVPNWKNVLPFWQPHLRKFDRKKARILTLGERDGGISLMLAWLGFDVVCTDRVGVTKDALLLHEQYGVTKKITYREADIFQLGDNDNTYDAVVCKSVIGGLKAIYKDKTTRTLKNHKKASDEVLRVLKPGGVFLGAENLNGSFFHKGIRKSTNRPGGWHYLSRADLEFIFLSYTKTSFRNQGFIGTDQKNQVLQKVAAASDRLLTKILPQSWLYIGFFAATK